MRLSRISEQNIQVQQNNNNNNSINNNGPSSMSHTIQPVSNGDSGLSNHLQFSSRFGRNKKKDKKTKGGLRKEDIGKPMDFRHVQHVGWNADTGYDVEGVVDKEFQTFFEIAGVSNTQLKDAETRQFIYKYGSVFVSPLFIFLFTYLVKLRRR